MSDDVKYGPCVEHGWLFDQTDMESHGIAAGMCATCPRLQWCEDEYQKYLAGNHVVPTEGTWAGHLLIDRKAPTVRRTCGTLSGAVAHHRAGERVCERCHDARLVYDQAQRAAVAR